MSSKKVCFFICTFPCLNSISKKAIIRPYTIPNPGLQIDWRHLSVEFCTMAYHCPHDGLRPHESLAGETHTKLVEKTPLILQGVLFLVVFVMLQKKNCDFDNLRIQNVQGKSYIYISYIYIFITSVSAWPILMPRLFLILCATPLPNDVVESSSPSYMAG